MKRAAVHTTESVVMIQLLKNHRNLINAEFSLNEGVPGASGRRNPHGSPITSS